MEFTHFKKILNVIKKKNIVIIGHMGSGKTVFSKKIASNYNIKHIDTDREIIKLEKLNINEIFLNKGEAYFRKIESKIVLNTLEKKYVVISLGGGSILCKKIREKLTKQSYTVFLDVDIKILNNRLIKSKNRPLLKDCNILSKIKQLDLQRKKHYLTADLILDNSKSIDKTFLNFINYFHH